jgi:hypothetical protein
MRRIDTPQYIAWLFQHMLELSEKFPGWDFFIIQKPDTPTYMHPQIRATSDYEYGYKYVATRLCKNKWHLTTYRVDEDTHDMKFLERVQLNHKSVRAHLRFHDVVLLQQEAEDNVPW